jgi:hypothetical protein
MGEGRYGILSSALRTYYLHQSVRASTNEICGPGRSRRSTAAKYLTVTGIEVEDKGYTDDVVPHWAITFNAST